MINENFEIKHSSEGEYEIIPEDMYTCEIADVQEKEQIKFGTKDTKESVLLFSFTILEGGCAGQKLWKRIRPIVGGGFESGQPSHLFLLLKAVFGTSPEEGRVDAKVVNSLVGKKVRLAVSQKNGSNNKVYNNIDRFYSLKEGVVEDINEEDEGEIRSVDIDF